MPSKGLDVGGACIVQRAGVGRRAQGFPVRQVVRLAFGKKDGGSS